MVLGLVLAAALVGRATADWKLLLRQTHPDAAAMEPDPKKWLNLAPSNPLADDYRYVVAQSMR